MGSILQVTLEFLSRSRRKLATGGVALLACFIAYHAVFGANGMLVYQHKKAEYRNLQRENEEMQKENERLQQRVKALKSDPETIEKEAREQLRYTRPGEMVYVVPEQDRTPAAPPAAARNHPPR